MPVPLPGQSPRKEEVRKKFETMTLQAIRWQDHKLQILDQLKLPKETEYIDVKNVEDGWQVINKMQVGGADWQS